MTDDLIANIDRIHEEIRLEQYHYARDNYNLYAKFLKSNEDNIRLQADFLNFMTEDWGLRNIYPDIAIIMLESMKKLTFSQFDDLSENDRTMVIDFFQCQRACSSTTTDISAEKITEIKEIHKKHNMMPTL